jgi:hypothetical protein
MRLPGGCNLTDMEQLLRNFDLSVVNPMQRLRSICHGIFFQSQMWLTAFERDQS